MPANSKPKTTPKPLIEETGYERLVFFSDAVMAIAITLLALEVRLPESVTTSAQLPAALLELTPQIGAYFISFFVIGTFWIGHHRMFTHIKRYNHGLLWINLLFLFLVAILPFPTSVLGRFPGNTLAVQFYAATVALIAFVRTGLWLYAINRKLIDPNLTRKQIQRDILIGVVTTLVFLVSIWIATFNANEAMYFWITLFVLAIVQRRIFENRN